MSTKLCHNKTFLNELYFLYSYSKTKTLITCSVVTSWSGSYGLYDIVWVIFHQDPFTRLRLVKGPDERSLNYELISKTQHLKKKSVALLNNYTILVNYLFTLS